MVYEINKSREGGIEGIIRSLRIDGDPSFLIGVRNT